MTDETLARILNGEDFEPTPEEQEEMVVAAQEAAPSLPPTSLRPPITFEAKKRMNRKGREYTYGSTIQDFLKGMGYNLLDGGQ